MPQHLGGGFGIPNRSPDPLSMIIMKQATPHGSRETPLKVSHNHQCRKTLRSSTTLREPAHTGALEGTGAHGCPACRWTHQLCPQLPAAESACAVQLDQIFTRWQSRIEIPAEPRQLPCAPLRAFTAFCSFRDFGKFGFSRISEKQVESRFVT